MWTPSPRAAGTTALGALRAEAGTPRCSIDVVPICDEEGSRFSTDFWGARAITGDVTIEDPEAHRDADGVSLAQAMREAGLDASRVAEARRDDVFAWLELHIEQGGTLEAEGLDIGVVHTITGHRQLRVRVFGRQDHAGTTPMDVRRDAIAGAAEMIQHAIGLAERMGRPAVCTVGRLDAEPGAFNVVPGLVTFGVDMRHADLSSFDALRTGVEQFIHEVAARRGLRVEIERIMDRTPVPLDRELQTLLQEATTRAGLAWKSMPSMAGHDTEVMAERWPSAMLFVPSRDGRSHTPAEFTPVEQLVPGVRILAAALHRLAY